MKLHLENFTDRNIAILAESHLSLVDKMNQRIKVADNSAIYGIKADFLEERVTKLEKEFAEFKNRTP